MAVDDSYTKVLLHGNGVDGGTVFTDEGGNTWEIIEPTYATIETDTAVKKFGTASIHKTTNLPGSVTSLRMTSGFTADLNPGAGDFTVDHQFQMASLPTPAGGSQVIVAFYANSSNKFSLELGQVDEGSPYYYFCLTGKAGGVSLGYNYFGYTTPSLQLLPNQLYHIELCRTGNDYKLFIEGQLLETISLAAHTYTMTSGGYIDLFNGIIYETWIDEFRYSVGIARHTSNFTPPTDAYGAQELNINADLVLPFSMGSVFMEGDYGDLRARLTLPLSMSGELETDALTINASLPIPFSMGWTFGLVNRGLNAPIGIPLSISGTLYAYPVINGTFFKQIPALSLSANAYQSPLGKGDCILPSLSLNGKGEVALTGSLSKSLPHLTLYGYGEIPTTGTAHLTLPMLTVSGLTSKSILGVGKIELPIFRLYTYGYQSISGSASVVLPMFTLHARITDVLYTSLVVNIKTQGMTTFANYLFNSMCHFQGKNLGATATSINDLDLGTTDNGAIIDWNFKIGHIDLHMKTKKKIRQAWLSCQITGDLIVSVITADGEEYEYNATSYSATEDGVRVKFGRGIRSKYISLNVKNDEEGSAIELDAIRLNLDSCGGRR